MINFTDPRLYVKGIASAMLTDKATGNIVYYSDKYQTGNIATSVTMGEIRAGLSNAIADIIPSDSTFTATFTAADFSMFAKAAQTGATLSYGAPVMVCQTVTATGTTLTANVSEGTPVAQLGFNDIKCYVQEVGASSPIATGGVAYSINPATGAVNGFTATNGKEYKIWYFVSKASAQLATINSAFNPKALHFTAELAVYSSNNAGANNTGTMVGSLYVIVPTLKFDGANGGIVGDQGTPDTTMITGQAIVSDSSVIDGNCGSCGTASNAIAYYLYVPCDVSANTYQGLALVGGVLSVAKGTTHPITEFKIIAADGSPVTPDKAFMSYTLSGAPSGTTATNGVINAGSTTGDGEITATYTESGITLTCVANLSIV